MFRFAVAVRPPTIGTTFPIVVSAFNVIVNEGLVSLTAVVAPVA
jgi:hypothetical protein